MVEPVRPDDWEQPVVLPPLGELVRVLVPFDGSHTAERALAWALRLAGPSAAEIVVVVAYERPLTKKGRGAIYVEDMTASLQDEASELAEEAVSLLTASGARARGVVIQGEPADAILEVAETESVGAVVIGARGLTSELRGFVGAVERFRGALQGSTADRVVRHASVPVMVVG